MKTNLANKIVLIFIVILLIVPTLNISGSEQTDHLPQKITLKTRVSQNLNSKLLEKTPDESLEVIAQFQGKVEPQDLKLINELGFKIETQYHAIPALHINGTVASIRALAKYHRLKWLEPNTRMKMDMEKSTSVINASKTWAREITGFNKKYPEVDGSGVTVVVVDTGIDAGHPDMDYGEKTLKNFYLDNDEGGNWVEQENTDSYYGHGTHVAGTVAGNGDASAGARRGVAPAANLIGVTLYDPTSADYIRGLEWVYDNSRPDRNPYNIRVATNSWHTVEEEYDPESALSQIIMKLTYENNVVTTWSAGNEGRTSPEGDEITTSKEGNTPVAIMVAAYERDGSAVTDFSSRGKRGWNHTYPDIGAPGRSIWSCSARRTVISGGTYVGGNTNPYYLAISGTSMSTPHIAGLVALLFQVCPSLKVSERHEDYSGNMIEWWSNPETRIHEAEWILEVSATYLEDTPEHGMPVPDNITGMDGRPMDYAQGYGIVDVEKAIGIALTLERLRTMYPGKDITVADALASYEAMTTETYTTEETNVLYAHWDGEYSRYNNQFGKPMSTVNQTKLVFVPEGVNKAIIDLAYTPISLDEMTFGDITYTIDYDNDGSVEVTGSLAPIGGGLKHAELDVSAGDTNKIWAFGIIGEGFRITRPGGDRNYVELRIEYSIDLQLVFDTTGAGGERMNNEGTAAINVSFNQYGAIIAHLKFGAPTLDYTGGAISKITIYYDISKVELHERADTSQGQLSQPVLSSDLILPLILVLLGVMILGYIGGLISLYGDWERRYFGQVMGLIGGVFVGIIFLHLLPGAFEFIGMWMVTLFITGFLVLVVYENLFHSKLKVTKVVYNKNSSKEVAIFDEYEQPDSFSAKLKSWYMPGASPHDPEDMEHVSFSVYVGIAIHNLTDGVIIASIFLMDDINLMILIMLMAFSFHDIPFTYSASTMMKLSGYSSQKIKKLIFTLVLFVPIGTILIIGLFSGTSIGFIGYLMAFAAGLLFGICVYDIIPKAFEDKKNSMNVLLFFIIGLALIGAFAIFG